jgi:acyl-CoA reductase-like NAD-dependent aldehyde dehydrogenase
MRPDLNQQLKQILDAHGEVFAALRTANTKMGEAIQAHDAAIERAIDANQAALRLLRSLETEP